MYDWPEIAGANDAVWSYVAGLLAQANFAAPRELSRGHRIDEPWSAPELVLAQTCGYPFATGLRGKVQLVGTPKYRVAGCSGTNYSSVIIASRRSGIQSLSGLDGAAAAINSETSQSGYWALRAALASVPGAVAPSRAVLSGTHRNSVCMVADGSADIAAIDAVCWALAQRHEPGAVAAVRIVGHSPLAPGLPLITARHAAPALLAALQRALLTVTTEPSLEDALGMLFWAGFEITADAGYDRILDLKRLALSGPFPEVTCHQP